MSYYNRSKFILTDHALKRISERLKIKNDDFLVSKIENLLKKSWLEFSAKSFDYYKIPNKTSMYFVVDSVRNVVLTVTHISDEKKIKLIS